MHEAGFHSRRPIRVPALNPIHRRARLAYARNHIYWDLRQWRTVLFTDEFAYTETTDVHKYGVIVKNNSILTVSDRLRHSMADL